MGRQKFHRQRVRSQAASVQAKSLLAHLASEIRHRREISPEEALLVAGDAVRFLERELLGLGLGQIELPCVAGVESHYRRARTAQTEKLARLTVVADEDASLLAEFGTRAMQQNRLARIIVIPRPVLAVDRYLGGGEIGALRRELAVSRQRWPGWWRAFREVVARAGDDAAVLAVAIGCPANWVAGWQDLWARLREEAGARALVGKPPGARPPEQSAGEEDLLLARLVGEHGYSPAASQLLLQELQELATRVRGAGRGPGQVVAFGVVADEPPGTSLAEARLALVVLDYVLPEDWGLVRRNSPQALKWARLERLATQAYSQGVALSLPDLAHLLGLSVDAVQETIKKHNNVLLPTRGRVADMGSTLTHAEKVVALFMDGYTETEIKRRTGHSYDSIERYLWDFARVAYLADRQMPLPADPQALALSRRLVERYLELYRRFNHPDYAFRMARIRLMAEGGGPGKDPDKSDWR